MLPEEKRATSTAQGLMRIAARHRLAQRELERAIFAAAHQWGLTQRQISDAVGVYSQATVQRILRRFAEEPARLSETPTEVIDQRAAGLISDDAMIQKLLTRTYTFGEVARTHGVATDAYTPGDWDEVEMAYYVGLLSDAEFDTVARRHLG
ncbi:hypothetical protein A5699_13190 [Mycobacterium sp. E802]|uniref:helix-turn-helix domain-containing protein n=1 Tax=Mycobacterium sp. E802 TaxID=1834152 RepID=UPI0007FD9AC8|nr:helix-turn-helix domain-containing protein [Mycobacterium sp. E802]OBG89624.1 hypothetical protein A5699_13190 [Mycobacterium sp. E802]